MSDFPRQIGIEQKNLLMSLQKSRSNQQWCSKEVQKRGGHNFHIFFKRMFFGWTKLKLIEKQEKFLGDPRHAPPEKFWKFTCCDGYFSAFCIIFRQISFKFFDPNLECFTKYDTLCLHIFDYACLRQKAYCKRRGSRLWKHCIHQILFLKMLVGGCIPFILPFWIRPWS